VPYLWVIGGRGGDNSGKGIQTYYNDIWMAALTGDPVNWVQMTNVTVPWAPRTGHAALYEPASPYNKLTRAVYVIGGDSPVGTGRPVSGQSLGARDPRRPFLADVWVWRLDVPGEGWREDYTEGELYGAGTGAAFTFANNSPTGRLT
jgi:hypothetical protein